MNDIQKKKHYDATISHLIKDCGFEDTPYLHTTIKRFLSIHRDIPLQKLQGVLLGAAAISKINKQDKFETLKQCLQYAFQTNDRHILDELMNIFSHIKYSHKATNRQDSTTHSQNLTPEERIAQIRSGLTNIEDVMQGCLTIANKSLNQSTISVNGSIDEVLEDAHNIVSIYQALLKHLPQGQYTSSTGKTFLESATQVITERLSRLCGDTLRAIKKETGKELDELFTQMRSPDNICKEAFTEEEIQSMVQNVSTLITWGNVTKFNLTATAINSYITKITEMAKKESLEIPKLSTKDILVQTSSLMQQAHNMSYSVDFLMGKKMSQILDDKTIREKDDEHLSIIRDIFPNLQLQGMTTAHHVDTITNRPSILKNLSPQILFNQTISLMDSIFTGLGQTVPNNIKKGSVEEKKFQRDTLKELGFDIEKLYHADNIPNLFNNLLYPKFKDVMVSNFTTLSQFLSPEVLQQTFNHNSNIFITNPDKLKEDITKLANESKSKEQLKKKLLTYINGDFPIFSESIKKGSGTKTRANTGKPHTTRDKSDNTTPHDLVDFDDIDLDGLTNLTGVDLNGLNTQDENPKDAEQEKIIETVSDETLEETYSNLLSELASLINVVKSILGNAAIHTQRTIGSLASSVSGMLNTNTKARMKNGVSHLTARVSKVLASCSDKDKLPAIYQLADYLTMASNCTNQLQQKLHADATAQTKKADDFYLQERKHKATAKTLAKYKNMSIETIDAMLKLKDLSPATKKELLEIKKVKLQLQAEYDQSEKQIKEGRANGVGSQSYQELADINRGIETIDILTHGLSSCLQNTHRTTKQLAKEYKLSQD